ncbi:LysR family transcriptional regulator [Xanthomonas oryzae pv. oryzae]|nr:LysR family transcriptional regulator [Xanthomonas oryzae pv. oryzae]
MAAMPDICPHSLLMRDRRTAHRHFGRLLRSDIVERAAHVDRTQEMTLFAALAEQASVAAVARRLGISNATVTRLTQVPSYEVREHLQNATLVCVLDAFEIAAEPVQVVYAEGRRGSSKMRIFIDECVAALRQDLGFSTHVY